MGWGSDGGTWEEHEQDCDSAFEQWRDDLSDREYAEWKAGSRRCQEANEVTPIKHMAKAMRKQPAGRENND